MWSRFTSHLYVRIWLAVVATVVVLAFLVGAAWQLSTDPPQLPIREVLVHNQAGEVIGRAQTKADRKPGDGLEFDLVTTDGQVLNLELPRPKRPPRNAWSRPPFGFGWMLGVVALAVAMGAYPIIRRLTQRLEGLQRGVERWGSGDLSARMVVQGEDEVAFLAERFNHAAERIETLMESQKSLLASHKSLLANASHELRSPLARIRMGLELMDAAPGSTQRAEISRSINELDQLIDEILLASRLDTKQADAEPFETLDLTGLAAEECARVQAQLGTALQTQSLTLQGSARLLRRLIRNLLENARRYSTGEVSLELSETDTGAQRRAVIRVNDHGPGVPPDQRERIFEPFYRLPGASEHEGGVGLGLALVKSITERHSGIVRCEDRPGGGASFVVELPMPATA
ncbi:HAMP domain-containing sensor histidine kinase [Polaromonas sp. A23]|uniref:HAMP domain-containing sensor histidine kinase n=1 Tax=Polaromonas sp. A23 TaxID=1944133 RepID=UPI000986E51D|nr:HAMP domain-containing sensor histidine kinase [Polaromonas sp. A23]OOG46186.1 two-component sensor histidine kinase [Polaromonas sp. A23]